MDFETLAGIYVYCMDHHEGQGSRLYRLMSRIQADLKDIAIKEIRSGYQWRMDKGGKLSMVYARPKCDQCAMVYVQAGGNRGAVHEIGCPNTKVSNRRFKATITEDWLDAHKVYCKLRDRKAN